jgi:hypothetical protein
VNTEGEPNEPPRMPPDEQSRYGVAAECALRSYPGPVGELIHRELIAYARFGRRFAKDALIPRLMTQMLTPPCPHPGATDTANAEPGADAASTVRQRSRTGKFRTPCMGLDRSAAPPCSARASFLTAPGPVLWPTPGRGARR